METNTEQLSAEASDIPLSDTEASQGTGEGSGPSPVPASLPPDSEQNALQIIQGNIDKFAKLSEECNTRGLRRVLQALAVQPLNQNPFHFSYPHEQELFDVGVQIQNAKLILLYIGLEQQKILNASQKEKQEEPLDMSKVTNAFVPGTEKTADEIRREGTYE